MVGRWAPAVRRITRRVLFHSMTGLTEGAAFGAIQGLVPWAGRLAHMSARVTNVLDISLFLCFGFVPDQVRHKSPRSGTRPLELDTKQNIPGRAVKLQDDCI